MSERRFRLTVDEPGADFEEGSTASLECAKCRDSLIHSLDAMADGFTAAELEAIDCACSQDQDVEPGRG